MSNDLSYINTNGQSVFTTQYLKNRGSCCQTNCLHCPYGTTLKKFGLQFSSIEQAQYKSAQKIIDLYQVEQNVASSLLASAFGSSNTKFEVNEKNAHEFSFVLLKNEVCGVIKHGKLQLSKLYLAPHFENQGLDKDIVQGYFIDSRLG